MNTYISCILASAADYHLYLKFVRLQFFSGWCHNKFSIRTKRGVKWNVYASWNNTPCKSAPYSQGTMKVRLQRDITDDELGTAAHRLTTVVAHKHSFEKFCDFEVTFEGHPIYSKTYFMNILKCFLMNIKCSLKIYFIMSEPHNMKIMFYGPPP